MKGFLEEYGLIIVVVAVILLMLLFGKSGYAKSIQGAILGSADHIVETGESVTKGSEVKSSDILNIEGDKYIALERNESGQLLVMTANSIGEKRFQSRFDFSTGLRPDGQNVNTYENSEIDNYLENNWYNSLSPTMKAAIQAINIKQASYANYRDPDSKQETGPNGQIYNTISRHVFLPSVSEIGKAVDLKNQDKIRAFLNGTDIWTRDSSQQYACNTEYLKATSGSLDCRSGNGFLSTLPAFVIDLSKVDYKVTGHVDYK